VQKDGSVLWWRRHDTELRVPHSRLLCVDRHLNPSRAAIQESVQGLNIFAGRSRECSNAASSAIFVIHDRGSAGSR
jgi:hypothetical protein